MNALIILALIVAPSLGSRLPYIIGGNDVGTAGKYPWQGSIQISESHICGCSLVADNWVITAGHCIMDEAQTILLGAHDITGLTKGDPQRHRVLRKVKHPDFDTNGDGVPNDIALMKLLSAADTGSRYISAIGLAPNGAKNDDYSSCVITGWGAIDMIFGIIPVYPDILQEANVGLYSRKECEDGMSNVGGATINDGHVCCGVYNQKGACSGDSGGPLTCVYGGEQVLVGLTSWGISTCDPIFPSVYTRVSYFRDWVSKTTDGDV